MRGHHVDAELLLQHVDRAGGRPVRRGQQDGVGVGMLLHQLAAHLDRGVLRDRADAVERAAPAGRAEELAAEMLGIAGDAVGVGMGIGLRHHRPSCSRAPWRPSPAPPRSTTP